MKKLTRVLLLPALIAFAYGSWRIWRGDQVGPSPGGGFIVATGQSARPGGPMAVINSRPVDLALSPDGRYAYLKDNVGLTVIDCQTMTMVKQVKIPGGDSFYGIVLSEDGHLLCTTTATNGIALFDVNGGDVVARKTITLPPARVGGAPHPCGIVFQDPSHVFVCLNRDNSVARVDLDSGEMEKWDTDVAPFAVAL